MRCRDKATLVLLSLLFVFVRSAHAEAQTLPEWLRVRPSYLAYSSEAASIEQSEVSANHVKSHRRASYLLAAGAGLVVGGAVHAALFGTKGAWCSEPDKRVNSAIPLGAILASAGVAMAIAAGVKLHRLPRDARDRRGGLDAKLLLTSIGTAAAAFSLPILVNYPAFSCIQS